MKTLILSLALAVSCFAQAKDTVLTEATKVQLQKELEFVGSLFQTAYAPKAWKESHLGWNLSSEMALAQARLASAKTMSEAQRALAGLVYSTADYHVGVSFQLTETATLPFQVKTVEGKTLIVYIDREKLSETAFPFSMGDEVLAFDGAPVAQVLGQMAQVEGANVPGTDAAIADLGLTRRRASRGFTQIPNGPVTVSVKKASDDSVSTVQLTWEYTPEKLNHGAPAFLAKETRNMFGRHMISPRAMSYKAEAEENTYGIGVRNSFLPDLGERIWETAKENTFDAYLYKNEQGQLIGVVRIFGYIVDDFAKAVTDFAGIMAHFQKHAAAVVVDQNHNPGGSVFYLYALASHFSDQALVVPQHQIAIQAADAAECVEMLNQLESVKTEEDAVKMFAADLAGYPVTYQLAMGVKDYCQFILKEYNAGKLLSEPYYLYGVDKINPAKTPFTKPVLILVNELDFSGGDFFPAILQDNKRVTIAGVRTAGAGGYVLEAAVPNQFGFSGLYFTGSLAARVNSQPIENLGVTPDVALPMTVDDVRNGYKNYLDGVRTILKGMVQ